MAKKKPEKKKGIKDLKAEDLADEYKFFDKERDDLIDNEEYEYEGD